ncbi:Ig-like domain-containing protein [Agaribacterium sp. ZY112]|uniref:Ig-like domain-containing protein n=1 Tax=Agaribacterium sp. ZY112 TaxID=3233574 RepID=UPI003525DBAD
MRPITAAQSLLAACSFLLPLGLQAQTETEINLNVEHNVGGHSEFDRKKYLTLHSTATENEWAGDEDKLAYVIDELDVYFGRDNGSLGWYMNQAEQDPERPGYADPTWVANYGAYVRQTQYGVEKEWAHAYDDKAGVMIGGQVHTFWPGHVTNPCCGGEGWEIGGADAMGDFMGQYINQFYRNDGEPVTKGHPRPKYLEVLNEPLYELVTTGDVEPIEVYQFHNDVAAGVRKVNSDVMIGGYTTAFPIFEERDFQRWEERMKLFIDTSGDHMDFFSIHLYDFNSHWSAEENGYVGPLNFKGGRIEATLDMMEQYSQIALGEVKPYIISEYGGRDHNLEQQDWSPYRDWHIMKAFSPMMMQFMARPDQMLKTIPFMVTKGEWGREDGKPYPWRLLRQANEASGESGEEWVFTDLVKFYELWSDVNGTRVDSRTTNPDVMIDTYVDGDTVYVILANLANNQEQVLLNMFGADTAAVQGVTVKQLFLNGDAPELSVSELNTAPDSITLAPEATAILAYSFDSSLQVNEQVSEQKYYASTYYAPILANQATSFTITGVSTSDFGEAVIRIGLGRDHGASLQPVVTVNGQEVDVPTQFAGDDQAKRDRFFGLIEVPVAMSALKASNTITVTFPDAGGHISSVTMEAKQFSSDIREKNAPVSGVKISPSSQILAIGDSLQVTASVLPFFAQNQALTYSSSDESIATVDQNGHVQTLAAGQVNIVATSEEGSFTAAATLTVEEPVTGSLSIDDASIYTSTEYVSGESMEVSTLFEAGTGETVSGTYGGVQYYLREMTASWAVVKDVIAYDGSVIGQQRGTSTVSIPLAGVTPTADLPEGNFYFLYAKMNSTDGNDYAIGGVSPIIILAGEDEVVAAELSFDNPSKYSSTDYYVGGALNITAQFEAGTDLTVNPYNDGVRFILRHLRADYSLVSDVAIAADVTSVDQQNGTARVSLNLSGLTPSTELPEGEFYFIHGEFYTSGGTPVYAGGIPYISIVDPEGPIPASVTLEDASTYSSTEYKSGGVIEATASFEAGSDRSVNAYNDGVRFVLRELTTGWAMVADIATAGDVNSIGKQNGFASASISLEGVTPTAELPEENFYYLYAEFYTDDGVLVYSQGVTPINIVEGDVEVPVPASIALENTDTYTSTTYLTDGVLTVSAAYDAGTGHTINGYNDGVRFVLREIDAGWTTFNDVAWASDVNSIGTRNGIATAEIPLEGLVPSADLPEGSFYYLYAEFYDELGTFMFVEQGVFPITIEDPYVPGSLVLENEADYSRTFLNSESLELSANFEAGTDATVDGGIQYYLREVDAAWNIINDINVSDDTASGQQTGSSTATISLAGLTPSADLPEGHMYFLFASFLASDGLKHTIGGAFPIIEADTDNDGIGNSTDEDDDNDGVEDSIDDFPLDPSIGVLGDFDWDQDIDRKDIRAFLRLFRNPADLKPEYDFDGSGKVTPRDVRALMRMCTRRACATRDWSTIDWKELKKKSRWRH